MQWDIVAMSLLLVKGCWLSMKSVGKLLDTLLKIRLSKNEHVDNFDVHFLNRSQQSHSNHNSFIDSLSLDQASDDVDDADIVACLARLELCHCQVMTDNGQMG